MFNSNQCVRGGVIAAVFLALGAGWASAGEDHRLIGFEAPNLKGDFAVNGEPTSIRQLKKKVVLLYFWAPWSPQCQITTPHIQDWRKKFGNRLAVVGVTSYFNGTDFDPEAGKVVRVPALNLKGDKTGQLLKQFKTKQHQLLKQFAKHYRLKQLLMTVPREDWKKVQKAYDFNKLPTAVIIDSMGVVRLVRIGATAEDVDDVERTLQKLINN